ncbi:LOW QUALITY PROTEIN: meckelin [Aphomia sociella]
MKSRVLLDIFMFILGVDSLHLICNRTEYYEPSVRLCQACPANVSMVTSPDGFSCVCEEHSVPSGIARCKTCNATELVSADGTTCVSRKCQNASGKYVCRKCPNDYISVTQNYDGSPMKEVMCIKCARGYKAQGNICVRCESCSCTKNQIVLRGICIPKRYLSDRPKHEETKLHPSDVLEFVKQEYLCSQNDLLACRKLARECVQNFYMADLAGPCRLWLQPKINPPKGLPSLTLDRKVDKEVGDVDLTVNKIFTLVIHISLPLPYLFICEFGSIEHYTHLRCVFVIPYDGMMRNACNIDISKLTTVDNNSTFEIFNYVDGKYKSVPVTVRRTSGSYVQKDMWPTNMFRRFFLVNNFLSTVKNEINTVYLSSIYIRIQYLMNLLDYYRIQRDKYKLSALRSHITVELQYATKSLSNLITIALRVKHNMPSAGVVKGLEIWGGVLGSLMTLYALVQWRGQLRRGGMLFSLVPLMAGAIADALYFAAWFSALHALAAEAGTLGITLPLSNPEEHIIKAFVYSSISLKLLKVMWLNWKQSVCDIFFLDWTESNSAYEKDTSTVDKYKNYKAIALAREWSCMQTKRRASPGFTVTFTLLLLYLMTPWQSSMPPSRGYKWTVATIAWWCAYTVVIISRFILDKVMSPPTTVLPKICSNVELSLLVFQDEYYAHYVHGRNDDSKELRSSSPLAMCRVVVAPQLRAVYTQLSSPDAGFLGDTDSRQALLSRFLAAFFERALDGLNWVASERSVLERLLDVELTVRESGSTSVLLYDPDDTAPSCFAVTWWCEEWTLATFDAMLFGSVVVAADDPLLAVFVTVTVWQIMKYTRTWLGIRNMNEKIGTAVPFYP